LLFTTVGVHADFSVRSVEAFIRLLYYCVLNSGPAERAMLDLAGEKARELDAQGGNRGGIMPFWPHAARREA
jgi:hypothetical protein